MGFTGFIGFFHVEVTEAYRVYVPWTFRYNVRSCPSFPIKTIECFMPEACQSWVYGLANSLILGNKSEGAFLFFKKNETTMK